MAWSFSAYHEELKLLTPSPPQAAARSFQLPMRNWNCNSFATNQHLSMVFSLPMRNWNGKDWRHSKKEAFSAYPLRWNPLNCFIVYKNFMVSAYLWGGEAQLSVYSKSAVYVSAYLWELKRQTRSNNWEAESFQPPMRSWNFGARCRPGSHMYCFQPTYEELKLEYISDPLPGCLKFSAYLWGIETGADAAGDGNRR